MGCGCKGKSNGKLPTAALQASSAPHTVARVAVYEVVKNNEVVLSTTNPSAARQEAKRLVASIRVTSRPVDNQDPVLV